MINVKKFDMTSFFHNEILSTLARYSA